MARSILLDELHVTVITPTGLSKSDYQAMLRVLRSKRFQARMHDAVRTVFRHYPSLNKTKFSLSR